MNHKFSGRRVAIRPMDSAIFINANPANHPEQPSSKKSERQLLIPIKERTGVH